MGGGLLLAAALAAVFTGGDDPSPRRATANTLAVIDPDSNRLVETIPTGVRPADVSAGADHVWVANQGDDTATQIDPRRREVVSTTAPGASVAGLAAGQEAVWIGDSASLGTPPARPRLSLGRPNGATRNRSRALLATRARTRWPPVMARCGWVAPMAAIARVDTRTRETQNISVGNSPSAVATGAGGVWVTDDVDNTVARIDPASANAVTGSTPVGRGPGAVATGAGAVWVANTQDDTVVRVDPDSTAVTDTIRVGRRPTGVAVGEGAVWVANSLSGTVSRIDPRTRRVEATVEVGEAPQDVAVSNGVVWVSVQDRTAPEPRAPRSAEEWRAC